MKFVKHEPMFFQADMGFALEHGGDITLQFVGKAMSYLRHLGVDPYGCNAFLDSRVHMLMPGWWPCIPGWHHDDVERSREDGQPNYRTASYRPEFLMGIVGSADCGTEFVDGTVTLPEVQYGHVIYQEWHPVVEAAVNRGQQTATGVSFPKRVQVQPNRIYRFTDRDFHQGVACKNTGWRWFGRITLGNPTVTPANEIRRNANVYMENPMEGW